MIHTQWKALTNTVINHFFYLNFFFCTKKQNKNSNKLLGSIKGGGVSSK